MSINFGPEMTIKLKSAIKLRLSELGAYVDDELPDYVLVMLANRRSRETMLADLKLFLGQNTATFIDWLHDLLARLQQSANGTPAPLAPSTAASSVESSSRKSEKKERKRSEGGHDDTNSSKSSHSHQPPPSENVISKDEFAEEMDHYQKVEERKASKEENIREHRSVVSKARSNSRNRSTSRDRSPLRRMETTSSHEKTHHPRVREARVAPIQSEVNNPFHVESVVTVKQPTPTRPRYEPGSYALIQRALREATANATRPSVKSRLGESRVSSEASNGQSRSSGEYEQKKVAVASPTKRKILSPSESPVKNQPTFVVTINAPPVYRSPVKTVHCVNDTRTIVVEKNLHPDVFSSPVRESMEEEEEEDLEADMEEENMSMEDDLPPDTKRIRKTVFMRDDEEDGIGMDEPQEGLPGSIKERCRYWPMCRNRETCPYLHPTEQCKLFPNCNFGSKCHFLHPPCKFQAQCANPQCPYLHTVARNPQHASFPRPFPRSAAFSHPPRAPPFAPRVFGATSMSMGRFFTPGETAPRCKYFPRCVNSRCPFWHPTPVTSASAHKWVSPTVHQGTTGKGGATSRQMSAETAASQSDVVVAD